jgi:hypothetical protein
MAVPKSPLHLAIALDGAGWHPAAWREPAARSEELSTARYWVDLVREAERGAVVVTHTEPFHISKAIATLDCVSAGRAGVRVQVSGRAHAVKNFGRRAIAPIARAAS